MAEERSEPERHEPVLNPLDATRAVDGRLGGENDPSIEDCESTGGVVHLAARVGVRADDSSSVGANRTVETTGGVIHEALSEKRMYESTGGVVHAVDEPPVLFMSRDKSPEQHLSGKPVEGDTEPPVPAPPLDSPIPPPIPGVTRTMIDQQMRIPGVTRTQEEFAKRAGEKQKALESPKK